MIDRMRELEGDFGVSADAAKEKAMELAATAREQFAKGAEAIKQYTLEKPAQALGLALGMGVLLGWLTKRR